MENIRTAKRKRGRPKIDMRCLRCGKGITAAMDRKAMQETGQWYQCPCEEQRTDTVI
jgi:hypothetical protein